LGNFAEKIFENLVTVRFLVKNILRFFPKDGDLWIIEDRISIL